MSNEAFPLGLLEAVDPKMTTSSRHRRKNLTGSRVRYTALLGEYACRIVHKERKVMECAPRFQLRVNRVPVRSRPVGCRGSPHRFCWQMDGGNSHRHFENHFAK